MGQGGTLTPGTDPRTGNAAMAECDRDRQSLAELDLAREFRQLVDAANRVNATVYAIDPRGASGVRCRPGPRCADRSARSESVDPRAGSGRAARPGRVASDARRQHRWGSGGQSRRHRRGGQPDPRRHGRVLPDRVLLDSGQGRWEVPQHLRQGQSARRERSCTARLPLSDRRRTRASAPPAAARALEASPAAKAIASLGQIRTGAALRARAGYAWGVRDQPAGPASSAIPWIVAELDEALLRQPAWQQGASVAVTMADASGGIVARATGNIPPKSRASCSVFLPQRPLDPANTPSAYRPFRTGQVRRRLRRPRG